MKTKTIGVTSIFFMLFTSSLLAVEPEAKEATDSFGHVGARADLAKAMTEKGAKRLDSIQSAFEREKAKNKLAKAIEAGANVASE